jgi:hypothetical protein
MPVAGRGEDAMSALKFRNITASVDYPAEKPPPDGASESRNQHTASDR